MITADTLESLMRSVFNQRTEKDIQQYKDVLMAALVEFEINTPERIAMFLAQVAHESGGLKYWAEIWGPSKQQLKYDPESKSDLSKELGNKFAGDGIKYRGRGPIQVTGRGNYAKYGELLGLDLETFPSMASKPDVGFRIAGCYWRSHGLNEVADENSLEAFKVVTKRINGGYNGLKERVEHWDAARKALGLE